MYLQHQVDRKVGALTPKPIYIKPGDLTAGEWRERIEERYSNENPYLKKLDTMLEQHTDKQADIEEEWTIWNQGVEHAFARVVEDLLNEDENRDANSTNPPWYNGAETVKMNNSLKSKIHKVKCRNSACSKASCSGTITSP